MIGPVNAAGGSVRKHNLDPDAHPDLRAALADLASRVALLEMQLGAKVTEHPFRVTFETLDGAEVTGVWNAPLARVEF